MKKLMTFVLIAFMLVFTFQTLPVPKSDQQPAVASTGQREAAKLADSFYTSKESKPGSPVARKSQKHRKNKIFENSAISMRHSSGFV